MPPQTLHRLPAIPQRTPVLPSAIPQQMRLLIFVRRLRTPPELTQFLFCQLRPSELVTALAARQTLPQLHLVAFLAMAHLETLWTQKMCLHPVSVLLNKSQPLVLVMLKH
jgi:hypothetical protein